jgi:hypothetical protein
MTTTAFVLRSLFTAVLAVTCLGILGAQTPNGNGTPLSLEDVVKQVQTGFSEELIITKIKKNGRAFDLNTEELLELKKAGVSDNVIKYLLDPSQPYSSPPAPATLVSEPGQVSVSPSKPIEPVKQYPEDPQAARVPPEPGAYHFIQNSPLKIDIKMLLGAKQGPGLAKVFMKKAKVVAYLVGPAAKTRISEASPNFYMRLPEGKNIEEVVLVALIRKSDRREVATESGAKQELNSDSMRPFDPLEVGARLFKITTSKLGKGEYLFFLVGSAEVAKGNYGKGYDFGIDELMPAPKAPRPKAGSTQICGDSHAPYPTAGCECLALQSFW